MSEMAGLKLLRRLEEGVAGKTGEAFFQQIVREIAEALDARGAFTSTLIPDRRARMQAFWMSGDYQPLTTYSLAGTPCEYVYNGQVTAYARNVGEIFPVDKEWFEQLGVKSYLGIPVRDENDQPIGHLAVMDTRERDWHEADVDVLRLFGLRTAAEFERTRHQRELEEANQRLRQEVEQRIAAEKELASAKVAAEAASQAKSVFISQMSHELRTPLNGILGYVQLLKHNAQDLNASQLDGLNVIERSGEHLLNLVNDLLDLAKIEADRLELKMADVALGELLSHVADLARVRAQHAGLRFEFVVADGLPTHVRADARALRQVLLNLLGNATKFTDRDGSVRLRVRSDGAAQPRIEFAVEDTGSGIPQDKLEHIFEPFYRVADSTRSVEGTGLGLAITRKLVGAMSGSIDVASRVGEGSTFTVTIPFEATRCDESLKSRADKILGYAGARRTIVIADDDEANRMLVSSLLESLGFIVKRACNGLEALQLCRASPVDLVVTDLVMPVVDGIELTGAIRGASATPIVALSASASSHTQREALQTGCNVFLTKPVNLQLLLGEIGRLLELEWRRSGADEVASAVQSRETMETDPKVARELYHFAQQGDINALLSRAEAALASNPGSQPFYVKIRTLAEQYDMGALRRMLAQQCNAP